jgi:hypothetical protein
MLHQILFLVIYPWVLAIVPLSPFAGVLLYNWLDNLPPDDVYSVTLIPGYISFVTGALTFLMWLIREKKTFPRPVLLMLLDSPAHMGKFDLALCARARGRGF